jgi:hypothetical protein
MKLRSMLQQGFILGTPSQYCTLLLMWLLLLCCPADMLPHEVISCSTASFQANLHSVTPVLVAVAALLSCRYAATRGDVMKLRSMLQQGFNPDSADYDGRTALMLACVRGHRDVVDLLLSAGETGLKDLGVILFLGLLSVLLW